jgi:hypothetical protein
MSIICLLVLDFLKQRRWIWIVPPRICTYLIVTVRALINGRGVADAQAQLNRNRLHILAVAPALRISHTPRGLTGCINLTGSGTGINAVHTSNSKEVIVG